MLWSFARINLGLTRDEFMALQPRQYDALADRYTAREKSNEFLFAQLTAVVKNFSQFGHKDPVRPKDYMPSEAEPIAEKSRTEIAEEIRNVAARWDANRSE